MAYAEWQKLENREARSAVTTSGDLKFQTRTYAVPAKVAQDELPEPGDLMHDETDQTIAWRVYEPYLGKVSEKGNRHVSIRYYKVIGRGTNTDGLVEVYRSRGHRKTGQTQAVGVRKFVCSNSAAMGLETGLMYKSHPSIVIPDYEIIVTDTENKENAPGMPGLSKIEARYNTIRAAGHATMQITGSMESVKLTHDLGGLQLVGPMEVQNEQAEMTINRGNSFATKPRSVYVHKAAFDTDQTVAILKGIVGKVNKYDLPNFYLAPAAGTLRCIRTEAQILWNGRYLWYTNVYFAEEEEGWNNVVKRRPKVKVPAKVVEMELSADGKTYTEVVGGDAKTKLVEKWGKLVKIGGAWVHEEVAEQDTVLYEEADFGPLNAMLNEW